MGKTDHKINQPSNSSLSYTLDHLLSFVEAEEVEDETNGDVWYPLLGEEYCEIHLSEKGQQRFLAHWQYLKEYFSIEGHYILRSGNNFPSDCGLASSASSFAALTKCAYSVAKAKGQKNLDHDQTQLAGLSRLGSGSSCRSFFSPWSLWGKEGSSSVVLAYEKLLHQAVIVNDLHKEVSSSEAHKRVTTSLLFEGRVERAESRIKSLIQCLSSQEKSNWRRAYEITWAEFWDMHALFETSDPAFGYMSTQSIKVLSEIRHFWKKLDDGPLVTMDAGANVHLLYRLDQQEIKKEIGQHLKKYTSVFEDV